MIIPVILSGGSGTRLWPLSRQARPKQFLPFGDAQESLMQQAILRLKHPAITAPYVVGNQQHRFWMADQLLSIGIDDATILLEPKGRNTAPAILASALKAYATNPNACLLVLASDHLIQNVDAFNEAISKAYDMAQKGHLVTFGTTPTYPATGYGYIEAGAPCEDGFDVARFVEKPDEDTAKDFIATNKFYWNSGMFMFRACDVVNEARIHCPKIVDCAQKSIDNAMVDLDFIRLDEAAFCECESISIDYAIMEHTEKAKVIPLDASWTDVGNWHSLWQVLEKDQNDNAIQGDVYTKDTSHSLIYSTDGMVVTIGLEDQIVVNTPDVTLVAPRSFAERVKEIVTELKEQGREECFTNLTSYRPWGNYQNLVDDDAFKVKRITVKPSGKLSLQKHHKRAEHWVIVQGVATVTNGEETFELHADQSTYIPIGTQHRLENRTNEPLVMIEVQTGSYFGEDDIIRLDDVYGRSAHEKAKR